MPSYMSCGAVRVVRQRKSRAAWGWSAVVALFCLMMSAVAANAQTWTWTQLSPTSSPSVRTDAMMAYNPSTGQVVLFGGEDSSGNTLNDTWVWDGTNWAQQAPATSPAAREDGMMAYDPSSGGVVLFGGFTHPTQYLNDTWVWNGSNWTEQSPATSPSAREAGGMATDTVNGRALLFGGTDGSGVMGDTWEWSGGNWTELNPTTSPVIRFFPAMAEEAGEGKIVLFGGGNFAQNLLGDTWEWDEGSGTWTEDSPANSPAARDSAMMAFDPGAGRMVLFGGASRTGFQNDTWAWDGSDWTQLTPATAPAARDGGAMAFDAASGASLLFGGESCGNAGCTAVAYDGDTWTLQSSGAPASQTISFSSIAAQLAGAAVPLSATATSGLPVSFQSLTAGVCSVSGSTATLLTPGTCTIQASQGGNSSYSAAPPVTVSFAVEGFMLAVLPGSETTIRGGLATFLVEAKSVNGFAGNVTITCSASAAQTSCGEFPGTVSVQANGTGYAMAKVLFRLRGAAQTYTVTFTGVSGTDIGTTTALVTVR